MPIRSARRMRHRALFNFSRAPIVFLQPPSIIPLPIGSPAASRSRYHIRSRLGRRNVNRSSSDLRGVDDEEEEEDDGPPCLPDADASDSICWIIAGPFWLNAIVSRSSAHARASLPSPSSSRPHWCRCWLTWYTSMHHFPLCFGRRLAACSQIHLAPSA